MAFPAMRNTLVQTLLPGSALTIPINPPIAANERVFFVSVNGAHNIELIEDDPAQVTFKNLTQETAPFVFSVGPRELLPPRVTKWLRLLGGL